MAADKRGFTLIELLVVISIIAMLLAILMPALGKVKEKAREVMCRSSLKQWSYVFYLYANDHGGKLMPAQTSASPGGGTWIVSLRPYYGDLGKKMCICPNATKSAAEGETRIAKRAWMYFDAVDQEERKNSYAINNWCYNIKKNVWEIEADKTWGSVDVPRAARIPMFLEGWRWGGTPKLRSDPPQDPEDNVTGSFQSSQQRFNVNRHNGGIGVCFMDGHVERVNLKGLWDLKWHKSYDMSVPLPTWPEWMKRMKE